MSPLSGVLTEAWYLYRRFAGHFLLIAFVVYLVTAVVVALLSLVGLAGAIIGAIIGFAATYVVQASLIKAVQDVRDGRADLDLSETVRAAAPYILPVIAASILAGIGVTIGFALLIVPGFVLLTFWCLIVPFIVLGRAGVFGAFGNSMRTVRGFAWRVFGTYVLVVLILIAFGVVLDVILLVLPLSLRNFVNSVVSGTLVAPFMALVATLIYYRLTSAHAGRRYVPTGPPGAPAWEPPYPPATVGPAAYPGPAPADSTMPPPTAPGGSHPTRPGSAAPAPDEHRSSTPPDQGPGAPPPSTP